MEIKKDDDRPRTNNLEKKLRCSQRALNLMIDTELFKRFKASAASNGETMTDIITDAMIEYLNKK